MERKQLGGHFSALVTVLIWGTTFISTKVLLADFAPVEILFLRFVMGFAALYLAAPRKMEKASRRQELTFAAAGLCGVCLYYLMENIALTYTMASNVGVIVSVSPFFTAILSRIILKEEKLHARFFLGFVVAMAGIALISFNGAAMKLNLTGDFLALMAALMWGCYSTFTRKISGYGFSTILTTRRTFFYGILFMIPALCIPDGYGTLFPARFHRKSLVSGPGRVGALLCHVELLREGAGRDQNQHLYLYDPGGYSADLCTGSERTGHLDDRGRHAPYAGRAVPVGREKRGK